MNTIPDSYIRVMPEPMHRFVKSAFLKAGMAEVEATLMAETLVAGDLRGVFSHGTQLTSSYVPLLIDGMLNPRPNLKVVQETGTSVKVDGDGGLGYFPSFKAIHMAVKKARETGMAVGMTSNHGHFGSAGHYARVAVDSGCFGLATSSHYREFTPDQSILGASGASPISMGIPSGDQPALVIDMASGGDRVQEFFPEIPGTYFKMLGFGLIAHALGGILAGMVTLEESGFKTWEGVNQGAFFIVVDIAQLTDLTAFRDQMDAFIGDLKQMRPPPGFDRSDTPGGMEYERSQAWRIEGVPVGEHHRNKLQNVAGALDIPLPWE